MLLNVHELPTNGDGLSRRFFLEIVHRLQPSGDLLNGEDLVGEEGLDHDLQLGVLLWHYTKKLLYHPLLHEVHVTMAGHLLL